MGRTQTFNTQDAVRAARTVFWEHGYEDASLPELQRATGLSRSSIYHAFGSKRGLFDAAVDNYLDEIIRPRLRPLTGPNVAPGAVIEYLTGLHAALERPGTPAANNGCLLINAAGAPIAHDASVAAVIANYRQELEDALSLGLAARLPDHPSKERQRLATVLTSLVVAAMALARIDNGQALKAIDTALQMLELDSAAA